MKKGSQGNVSDCKIDEYKFNIFHYFLKIGLISPLLATLWLPKLNGVIIFAGKGKYVTEERNKG